ncbi:hypothetical protein [Haloglomus halophilum]|uniref:hypothetical protein n=1 Tax=Haloglomus halophilum TaxID=2962672 RepID=UPI0020CA0620|nr:hypothetical protein [Haloglomus halophilum]
MKLCPCKRSDRGARYGAQTGAYLGTKVGSKHGGPFATGFNAGLGAALGYVGGSLLDSARQQAKPTIVPDGGEVVDDAARPTDAADATGGPDDGPTDIPVTEGSLFE